MLVKMEKLEGLESFGAWWACRVVHWPGQVELDIAHNEILLSTELCVSHTDHTSTVHQHMQNLSVLLPACCRVSKSGFTIFQLSDNKRVRYDSNRVATVQFDYTKHWPRLWAAGEDEGCGRIGRVAKRVLLGIGLSWDGVCRSLVSWMSSGSWCCLAVVVMRWMKSLYQVFEVYKVVLIQSGESNYGWNRARDISCGEEIRELLVECEWS